jgi:hypothetical protein
MKKNIIPIFFNIQNIISNILVCSVYNVVISRLNMISVFGMFIMLAL